MVAVQSGAEKVAQAWEGSKEQLAAAVGAGAAEVAEVRWGRRQPPPSPNRRYHSCTPACTPPALALALPLLLLSDCASLLMMGRRRRARRRKGGSRRRGRLTATWGTPTGAAGRGRWRG